MKKQPMLVLAQDTTDLSRSTAKNLSAVLRRAGFDSRWFGPSHDVVAPPMLAEVGARVRGERPSVVVAVNHTRMSLRPALDKVPVVVSWMQDDVVTIKAELAGEWNATCPRDVVMGFAHEAKNRGYDPARLHPCPMVLDPDVFRPPRSGGGGPLFLFASHKGEPVESYIRSRVVPAFPPMAPMMGPSETAALVGATRQKVEASGKPFQKAGEYMEFGAALGGMVSAMFSAFRSVPRFQILMFWHVADRIYRHSVAGWMRGMDHRVAGRGWSSNPLFEGSAMDPVPRDSLPPLYGSSGWCLHVNSQGGYHHRLAEILMSGGRPLVHGPPAAPAAKAFDRDWFARAQDAFVKRVFKRALSGEAPRCGQDYVDLMDLSAYCRTFSSREDLLRIAGAWVEG